MPEETSPKLAENELLKFQMMYHASGNKIMAWFLIALVVEPTWFKVICVLVILVNIWEAAKIANTLPTGYFLTGNMLKLILEKQKTELARLQKLNEEQEKKIDKSKKSK